MRTIVQLTAIATAIACSLATAQANARARTFVASYGDDANPCTFGSPCKTFQVAVNVVDAGGEVTAIDSAGFGPITVTKAVTITSPDGVEAGIVPPTTGGNAITIDAGSTDAVVLRGLTLNGSAVVGFATNGIVFNSGASLAVVNCLAQNFHGSNTAGILIQPASGTVDLAITNTITANNENSGIQILPSGSSNLHGAIDHVVVTGNSFGIAFNSHSTGAVNFTLSNSVATNNSITGIAGQGTGTITVSIDNVIANSNSNGMGFGAGATVFLGRSVITENTTGILNTTSNKFFTYKDNRINGNGTDICSTSPCVPLNTTLVLQ